MRHFNTMLGFTIGCYIVIIFLYSVDPGLDSDQLHQIQKNCNGMVLLGDEPAKLCLIKALL